MSSTLAQLRYFTQYLVGDPQMTTYSMQMYADSINFAVKEYAHKTGVTYTETPSITVSATGIATIPATYLKVNRVIYGGAEMVESDFKFESYRSATWQTDAAVGGPKRWVLWSGASVKLTPLLATWPGTCTIGFTDVPTALATDTDTVDSRIPASHNEYLKYAAVSWLLNLDGDGQDLQQANMFMQEFNQLIGYADPVLTQKLAQLRKDGKLEI